MMDIKRIDKDLKNAMDNVSYSLEIDEDAFLNHPENIQKEREEFAKNNPATPPDSIDVKNIFIQSTQGDAKIRLRIYQSKKFEKNRVMLYFHGGGYIFGLPEQVDDLMFKLSDNLNAVIISVDYRLSPQYRFPVPVLDGFDALNWVINYGKDALGIDPTHVTVFGASAGGHLAAAITQMAVDNNIENIQHQFLLYPVIHNNLNTPSMNEFTDAPLWNKKYAEIAWLHFLGHDNLSKSIKYADLINYDNFEKLPKTTIVGCELDPLRDEGIAYAELLYKAGVKTELWIVPGAVHVFDLFSCSLTDIFHKFLQDRLFS